MDQEILKKITEKLDEGEKLLWTGRPESFEVLDKTHRDGWRKHVIYSAIVTLLIMAAYVTAALHYGAAIQIWLLIVMALVGCYSAGREWLDAGTVRSKLWYAATDQRLLVVSDAVSAVRYETIPKAAFRRDEDGHVSLLCGEDALKKKPYTWRSTATVSPITDLNTGICDQLVLYAVPEADKVEKLLADYIPLQ